MTAELRQHCQRRKAALLAERAPYESAWREVADYGDPYAGKYLTSDFEVSQRLPSRRNIINSTISRSLRTMDAGFVGGHTSKSRPWFRLGVSDPALLDNEEIKVWLDDETQAIRDTLARSNFYTALSKLYHSRHLFGIGAIAVEEDDDDVVRFYVRPIGTYAVGVDHRGRCNAFWYRFRWTAENIVAVFGEDGLPEAVRSAKAGGRPDQKFQIESLIEKNPDYKRGSHVEGQRKYRQIYWIDGGQSDSYGVLGTNGYDYMPTLTPRWLVDGNDVYGPSPALDCVGDLKQLQHQEGDKIYLSDMIVRPPVGVPDTMRNKAASLAPGSRTYLTMDQVGTKVGPLYVPDARAKNEIRLDIDALEKRIGEHFYADLFRMLDFLDDRQRTATEISARQEEKAAMLGPSLETLTDELLDPVIEIVFAVRAARGLQRRLPEALDGVALKVEYTSILAQAQKAVGINSIERVLQIAGGLVSVTQDPSVMDKLNSDAIIEITNDFTGAPARIVNSDDAVAAKRQQRAQQQQMQQMAALAPAAKQGMDAMRTAAETVPQDGSALAGLMGG